MTVHLLMHSLTLPLAEKDDRDTIALRTSTIMQRQVSQAKVYHLQARFHSYPVPSGPPVIRAVVPDEKVPWEVWINSLSLRWRHSERAGVSNHRRLDCLLNRLCRRSSLKKASKLRVTGLCERNPPVTDGLPSQRASNAENVSIWWRYHGPLADMEATSQV